MWWYLQADRVSLVTPSQDMIMMHNVVTKRGVGGGDDVLLLMPHGELSC